MRTSLALRPARWFVAAFAAVVALAYSVAPAQADVVAKSVAKSPAEIRAYWTPQRMQSAAPGEIPQLSGSIALAQPTSSARGRAVAIDPTPGVTNIDFEPGSETGYPQSVHGKIFFTIPGVIDAFCSGTLVASRLKNVVFTAGHCVHNPGAEPSINLVFVPGYRDGSEPFGEYPAATLLAPEEWTTEFDSSYDIAIAQLSVPLENQLGARGIAFNKAPKIAYQIFGYPGKPSPPYDGQRLIACTSDFFALENAGSYPFSTVAYPCGMAQGASGGGWVNSSGQVVSVSSHIYTDPALAGLIAGPYFGSAAKELYNRAGGSAECPPATEVFKQAKKRLKTARKAAKRHASAKAKKKLRRASKRLSKAKSKRNDVC